ncbi:PA domain-containing protein [Williamsia limnetica]|uniref:PA domain-containing protein n=1 Tax=Williamsia limnetica TaxID=882452 RepID=UPI001313FC09|nr:PA domain-containing protein [Williamsia limnetica]
MVASVDGAEVALRPFGFSRGADIANVSIVQAGDGCNGEAFGDSPGSVVVVEPGGCPIDSKYANSVKAGASGLLVAEVAPLDEQAGQWSSPPLTMTGIPVLFSTSPDSAELLKKGGAVSIQFAASVGESEN